MPTSGSQRPHSLVTAADLAGTFLFAVEGALAAIAGHLDLFGVMVLGFTTALGGGIIRDALMGSLPPAALSGWSYPATAFVAAGITFVLPPHLHPPTSILMMLDAAGLALFAVAGTTKALDAGMQPLSAVLLGTITGVGGGTIRDLFLARVPAVLRVDVYATAALFGAVVLFLCRRAGLSPRTAAFSGGIACFGLRLLSVWHHWQLPGSTGGGG